MKKYLSVLTAFIIFAVVTLFACITAFAQSVDIEKTQLGTSDTYYSYDSSSKTLTISGTGATPNFTNSSSTDSSQPWFSWRSDGSIEHIVVEEGITSLGRYLFYCVSTADISLPSTLVSIDSYAMAGTNSNKNPVLPENLTTIGAYAFYYTAGLEKVYIPSSVEKIGQSAFELCTSLSQVEFESWKMSVSIGSKAFFKCANLKSVTVPKYATLSSYSFGYYDASAGSVYDGFVLFAYRDSQAYEYAKNSIITCKSPAVTELYLSDSIELEYYADNVTQLMVFSFTAPKTDYYKFYSTSDIDLKCAVKNSSDKLITQNDDISQFDTDFKVGALLNAFETYYFIVGSNNYTGRFTVSLSEATAEDVTPTPIEDDNKNETPPQQSTTVPQPSTVPALPNNTTENAFQEQGNNSPQTTAKASSSKKKPPKTSIKKLVKGKKSFKIIVKKVSKISGYQVIYSTNKKFKKSKKVNIKKTKTSTTVKKLKSKKTYYVKVRTYKNVKANGNTKRIYSSWSKVKKIKVK